MTLFGGTSLTTDSFLEMKYLSGSQCSWWTRCDCSHWNVPLPDRGILDMIGEHGPLCAKCGRALNFDLGHFVPTEQAKHDAGRISFHIPKIINPAVWKDPSKWAKIYEMKLKHGNNNKFKQEVLGIATEEGEREITKKNLMDLCEKGVLPITFQNRAIARQFDHVVSGCDWGGSDHNPTERIKLSTTVHVMLGVAHDGACYILHMRRYFGMNYADTIGDILANHNKFRGQAIASDHGMGMYYNAHIREALPESQHLIFEYTGPTSAYVSEPKSAHAFNYWTLNKTESISQLYEAVRSRRLRCYDWTYAEEHLSDFLNLYRAPAEMPGSGASTVVYRSSASKPNDTLQAVNYAYTLARIVRGEPLFSDRSIQIRLQEMLAGNTTATWSGQEWGGYSG